MHKLFRAPATLIQRLADDLLYLVIPPRCGSCLNRVAAPRFPLCSACRMQMNPHSETIGLGDGVEGEAGDSIWLVSGSQAGHPALNLVHRLKYSGSVWLAPAMAELMSDGLGGFGILLRDEVLVPIPLHPTRKRERGYNQSTLLALQLSEITGVETREVLVRVRRTGSQTALDVGRRKQNVLDAFAAGCDCRGLRTVIVDDVATSGATIREAAKAIRSAGGEVEGAVTFVRA